MKKCEEYEMEIIRLGEELKTQGNMKIYMEQTLEDKIQRLEMKVIEVSVLDLISHLLLIVNILSKVIYSLRWRRKDRN